MINANSAKCDTLTRPFAGQNFQGQIVSHVVAALTPGPQVLALVNPSPAVCPF